MSQPLSGTVSPARRAVSILLESGATERFALVEGADGDVGWRHDTFAADDWLAHGGRLTVGDVVARVPDCGRHVVAWTRAESS
jgi:hypothetical protein